MNAFLCTKIKIILSIILQSLNFDFEQERDNRRKIVFSLATVSNTVF